METFTVLLCKCSKAESRGLGLRSSCCTAFSVMLSGVRQLQKNAWFQKRCQSGVFRSLCSNEALLMHRWGTSSLLALCVRLLHHTLLEAWRALDSRGRHQSVGAAKGFSPCNRSWEMEDGKSLCTAFLPYITQNLALLEKRKSFGYFTTTVKLLFLPPTHPSEKKINKIIKIMFNLPACKWLLNNTVVFGSIDQRDLPMRTAILRRLGLALFQRNWMCFCCF